MLAVLASYAQFVAIYIILGWAIYLVFRGGQLSAAPIYTMAIGAYASAYAVRDLGWPFATALVMAVGFGALATFLPALKLSRAPGFAAIIATVAGIFITQTVIRNLGFLGGLQGIYNIPRVPHLVPLAWVSVVIIGFFIYRLENSSIGRATEVAFTDPDLASTFGTNIYKTNVFLWTAAGAMGALAGGFYAATIGAISPGDFGLPLLLLIVTFVFIGGYTTMWGVVIFTPIMYAISMFLPEAVAIWRDIICGALLIGILILRPEGAIDKKTLRALRLKS